MANYLISSWVLKEETRWKKVNFVLYRYFNWRIFDFYSFLFLFLILIFSSIHKNENQVLTTSANADMTFPNVVRDLLMFAPSWKNNNHIFNKMQENLSVDLVWDVSSFTFNLVPLAPVESALSLPARSTRLILLTCSKPTNHDAIN